MSQVTYFIRKTNHVEEDWNFTVPPEKQVNIAMYPLKAWKHEVISVNNLWPASTADFIFFSLPKSIFDYLCSHTLALNAYCQSPKNASATSNYLIHKFMPQHNASTNSSRGGTLVTLKTQSLSPCFWLVHWNHYRHYGMCTWQNVIMWQK